MDSPHKYQEKQGWDALPLDVLLQIGKCVTSMGETLAPMRETCSHWRAGVDGVDAALTPLGLPHHYDAYPRVSSVNIAARGHGVALTSTELAAMCTSSSTIMKLNLSGAFQLTALDPLAECTNLSSLTLDDTTLTDDPLAAVLPALSRLEILSLRGCGFLKGEFISSLRACTRVKRLDLADCALALHLSPLAGKALAALVSLEILDLAGCGPSDATLELVATLPHLRAVGLRDAHLITEIGLEALAAGPAGKALATLDLEGCSGLGEGFCNSIVRFPALKDLSLARLPHLLQTAPMAEQHAAALWRWPHLRRLSLAGSAAHPFKLKLLAATCGVHLTELDIGMPSADDAPSLGSLRGYLSRMPAAQERDLLDCARSFKNLRVLRAPRSGLPIEVAVALMRSAPRMEELDLSGCSLSGRGGLGRQAGAGRWWSSGVFMPGSIDRYRAATEDVSSKLASSGPVEFAAALGALTMLRTLRLRDCGLSVDHLHFLRCLNGLETVNLAGNRALGDVAVDSFNRSAQRLVSLDVSGIPLSEESLKRLAARGGLSRLQSLRMARCGGGVTAKTLSSISYATGGCRSTIRDLDVSDCLLLRDDGMASLVTGFPHLTSLCMSGCSGVTSFGFRNITSLCSLRGLEAARCGQAVTDDNLIDVCQRLGQLTRLSLGGAHDLTRSSLSALGELRCLSKLDLTCCSSLGSDEDVPELLPPGMVAVVQLPQGAKTSTGSPLKRHRPSFHIGQQLTVE